MKSGISLNQRAVFVDHKLKHLLHPPGVRIDIDQEFCVVLRCMEFITQNLAIGTHRDQCELRAADGKVGGNAGERICG